MKWAAVAAGVVVLLAGITYVAIYTGLAPAGRLDGLALQKSLTADISERVGTDVHVRCPKDEWKQKNRIIDCQARRLDNNARSDIRVTQDDHRGHYRFELVNPLALIAFREDAPDGAAEEVAPESPPSDAAAVAGPEDEPQGDCGRVPETWLRKIASNPRGDAGSLVLPSAYQLEGERGYVVGGFLSSEDGGVDGAFGTWFVSYDGEIYAYTDAALGLTNWPQIGEGDDTDRTRRVRACAESNAG